MSDGMVTIPVSVPLADYPKMAQVAELRGFATLGEFLGSIASALPGQIPEEDYVVLMVRAGLSDQEIAERTGLLLARVGNRRRAAGLRPNPNPRRRMKA